MQPKEPKPAPAPEASSSAAVPATPAPAQAATPAPPAAPVQTSGAAAAAVPATPTPNRTAAADPGASDANALAMGEQRAEAIANMEAMGFERPQIDAAMRAAFYNPERAVEYLLGVGSVLGRARDGFASNVGWLTTIYPGHPRASPTTRCCGSPGSPGCCCPRRRRLRRPRGRWWR